MAFGFKLSDMEEQENFEYLSSKEERDNIERQIKALHPNALVAFPILKKEAISTIDMAKQQMDNKCLI